MRQELHVLLVEDRNSDVVLIERILRSDGLNVLTTIVDDEEGFREQIQRSPDVILCDWSLPQFGALRALEILHECRCIIPLIIVSGSIGEEAAIQAIKHGASDYLLKDRLGRLTQSVRQAVEQRKLRDAAEESSQRLQESEKHYRILVDGIPQIVWTVNTEKQIDYFNQKAGDYLGVNLEALRGEGWKTIIHPNDLDQTRDQLRQAIVEGQRIELDCRLKRHDGEYRWHIIRMVALRDDQNRIVRWFGTGTDIHEQRESAERHRHDSFLLANVRDALIVTDLDGSVRYWNDGATRLLGWTSQEMIGHSYADRYPEPEREEVQRMMEAFAEGLEWSGEHEELRKDGNPLWVQSHVSRMMNLQGEPIGILRVSYDISDRKRLEEQVRQSQKMEAVGRLAGGVAHDFNNLLTVINSYCELLLYQIPKESPQWSAVTAIRDAGTRAAGLTAQLLAFSRKAFITPRLVNLNDLLNHSEELLRRLIGEDIELVVKKDPSIGSIRVDPVQLDQVLMNLAANSRDAMPNGGKLEIQTKSVFLTEKTHWRSELLMPGSYVDLEFHDSGLGIEAASIDHIFEPFYTTKGPGKGTGLGLAVVHGIVKQAGGFIQVESQIGSGTTFRFRFPVFLERTAKIDAVTAREDMHLKAHQRILLVEDEASVRSIARAALQARGYEVFEAAKATDALQIAAELQYDFQLLVTDVVMPDLNGRELANLLRQHNKRLNVLFVSGYTDDIILKRGVNWAEDSFLPKPFTPGVLTQKVQEILNKQN